jgi:hypothetical protein
MAFWLEAVFGIPYGARDKVRQLAQQVEWVAASTRDNRHAFLTKTKRRKKGGSDSRVQREQQARGGLIKRFFSKQEWNLVQRIGSEQGEHGRPLERFQASSAHDAARGAAARCFKGW